MSKIKPLTKLKKFNTIRSKVVDDLYKITKRCSPNARYTNIKPHKESLIYVGITSYHIETMTFCFEMEYNGILMIFYYEPNLDTNIEYEFAYKWLPDEIEEGSESIFISPDIDEAQFFQQSLIDDMHFLSFELHQGLAQYCNDIRNELIIKIQEDSDEPII